MPTGHLIVTLRCANSPDCQDDATDSSDVSDASDPSDTGDVTDPSDATDNTDVSDPSESSDNTDSDSSDSAATDPVCGNSGKANSATVTPLSCSDNNGTTDSLIGAPETCDAVCQRNFFGLHITVTVAVRPGVTLSQDNDCQAVCGERRR